MKNAEHLLGSEVEILLGQLGRPEPQEHVQGQVLALEPRFGDVISTAQGQHGGGGISLAFAATTTRTSSTARGGPTRSRR